jgi:hypothetical protein
VEVCPLCQSLPHVPSCAQVIACFVYRTGAPDCGGIPFCRFWLDPLLKTTLEEHVAESSKGMYALRIEQLHVNPFTGSAEADGIQLSTDSIRWDSIRLVNPDAAPMKVDGQIRRLRVKNLGLIKYWRSKDISLSKILVLDSEINLSSVQDTALEKAPQ